MRRSGRQSLVPPEGFGAASDSVRNRRVNRRSAEVAARRSKFLGGPIRGYSSVAHSEKHSTADRFRASSNSARG